MSAPPPDVHVQRRAKEYAKDTLRQTKNLPHAAQVLMAEILIRAYLRGWTDGVMGTS